jgi:hypothetical protein
LIDKEIALFKEKHVMAIQKENIGGQQNLHKISTKSSRKSVRLLLQEIRSADPSIEVFYSYSLSYVSVICQMGPKWISIICRDWISALYRDSSQNIWAMCQSRISVSDIVRDNTIDVSRRLLELSYITFLS